MYIIAQVLDATPGILYEATGSPEVEGGYLLAPSAVRITGNLGFATP